MKFKHGVYEGGYLVMLKPDGSRFLMPHGPDPQYYIGKGFTVLTDEMVRSGSRVMFDYSPETGPVPFPRVHDGDWSGERCFIVGGGPSLRGFDWGRLRGERVIAVNRAFEQLPFADISVSLDERWHGWTTRGDLGDGPRDKYAAFKGVKVQCWPFESKTKYPLRVQIVRPYGKPTK